MSSINTFSDGELNHTLPPPFTIDLQAYSGISFRKAAISSLWERAPAHRVMQFGDHKQITSTAAYATDTVERRAELTHSIAAGFASGF